MGVVSLSLPADGTTGTVSQYNTPLTTLQTEFNGNIDNNNIKTSAGIATSKLADDGGIGGAKLASASVGPSKLALLPQTAATGAGESTASQTYVDLATVGPTATAVIGANGCALVTVTSLHFANAASSDVYHSFAVSGASTQAATDARGSSSNGTAGVTCSTTTLVTGLTAGSNVFTSKYRVSANTGTWLNRSISVVPL
jgi:hypothetical protein